MFRTIVVGTDGSKTAYRAVRRACDLARLCSARLHVVTAYRPMEMHMIGPMGAESPLAAGGGVPDDIEALVCGLVDELSAEGLTVIGHAVAGRAADAILDIADAEQADAIVVGNRGVQRSRPSLGSVPLNVLQHASCTVLVIPTTNVTGTGPPR